MYSPTHCGVGESSFAAGQLHSKLNLRILSSKMNVSMHKGVSMRGGPGVFYPGKPIGLGVLYPGVSIIPELPTAWKCIRYNLGGPSNSIMGILYMRFLSPNFLFTGQRVHGPPTPPTQNSPIWPLTAPGPQTSDSSCPFHENPTRGEVGGPKSDRF